MPYDLQPNFWSARRAGFVVLLAVFPVSFAQTISLDPTQVWFGATNGGAIVTAPQTVSVLAPAGVNWSASSNRSYMTVNPASGAGNGTFTISITSSALPTGMSNGIVTVTPAGVSNSPQSVQVFLNVMSPGSVGLPFGSFDTPAGGSTGVSGGVAVTGWALDAIGVANVQIFRDPLSGEAPGPNGLIYIGDAAFLTGARPDVQALYPAYPLNDRAGWGYLLLSDELPNPGGPPGNGTYKLHAIATSMDGQALDLGARTITVQNATATLPFGTIDTPAQGATVSGTVTNFGWALTPPTVGCPAARQPCIIPVSGSTIVAYVDGIPLGNPAYNLSRCDVDQLFPAYANSGSTSCALNGTSPGPVGYLNLDSTQLTNGVHTIAWSVTDNAGRVQGIGSRYFTVANSPATPVVTAPPVITSASSASGTVGSAFSYQITATNNPTSFNAAGLPAGLSFNAGTGIISGTPTAAGRSAITLSATNTAGTGTATLTLTIATIPPVITSATTASGTVGSAFSYQITATNSPTSYGALTLPLGLSLNTLSGLISGAPTLPGTTHIILSATNAAGTGSATLTLTIAAIPPVITSAATASGTAGVALSYQITASNSPTSFNATGLPASLSVNTGTGLISGTPTSGGTSTVTLSASNAAGTGSEALTLTVAHSVIVNWVASTSTNIAYYNLYRGTASGGPYTVKVNSGPILGTSYTDTSVQLSHTYYYVGTAVDVSGIESVYSTPAAAVIPAH